MTTTEASPMDARDPLARTATTRRVGLAVAMLLAPWFIVAAEVGHAAMTLHGGDDLEPSSDLARPSRTTAESSPITAAPPHPSSATITRRSPLRWVMSMTTDRASACLSALANASAAT